MHSVPGRMYHLRCGIVYHLGSIPAQSRCICDALSLGTLSMPMASPICTKSKGTARASMRLHFPGDLGNGWLVAAMIFAS